MLPKARFSPAFLLISLYILVSYEKSNTTILKRVFIPAVPKEQSFFLLGARQTGKSTYLKAQFPQARFIDLLDSKEYLKLSRDPSLLREEILRDRESNPDQIVIIDEIQKLPFLLNEIQLLIDRHQVAFILCGSSARQLKGHSVNLLGGRAWIYNFMPLTSAEIQSPNLLHMLQYGLLPRHYLAGSQEEWFQHVEAYIHLYLTEEVKNEGLVRNLSLFVKFLDVVGFSQGELVSFSNISRETGVSKNTAQSYFQILVDTMMGYFLEPYAKTIKRTLIQEMPKFYLFDIGIANVLARRSVTALKGDAAGKAFEHFIFMELIAYNRLKKKRFEMYYWRTKSGYEVDFVLGDAQVAIEVKISDQVHKSDFKGLIAFKEDYPHTRAIVVSQDLRPRKIVIEDKAITLEVLPWLDFVRELWVGGVI